MSDTILCVDIGTTSLKAALVTAEGEVVAFKSLLFDEPHDRFIAASWYSYLLRAVEKMSEALEPGDDVKIISLSISGNGPTVVTDSALTYRWNEDTSAVAKAIPDCARSSIFIPKILYIKKEYPEIWKKTKKLFSGPEYLIYVLTGQAVTILPEDRFSAAYWNEEKCQACKIDFGKLPPFVRTGADCGKVNVNLLAELQNAGKGFYFSDNCSVFAGGPDFVVALIGTGTLKQGMLCDRCGSSEGLNFCTEKMLRGEGLRILPSVLPGLWNASYLIPNSGQLSEEERLMEVERGIECLKRAATGAGVDFPCQMAVTGGQTNDELLLREKSERLGMKIFRPAGGGIANGLFVHSELIGDACAAWYGIGKYSSLQNAAEKIVRLEFYENL